MHWPKKPFIYQINTWVWLNTLSRLENRPITLDNVPESALDELASFQVDAVWLMGVWYRGPAGRANALKYIEQYRSALPDIIPHDVVGSAYAVGMYQVDERLGGRLGLAQFRQRLAARGMRLILDFVPNHVAIDHAWVTHHPDYMVHGQVTDLVKRKDDFFAAENALGKPQVVGHGRDPYFPGWSDTAQINAFSAGARAATVQVLLDIANQCDGLRCDMAMLMLNDIFSQTWGGYAGQTPKTEYWLDVIPPVKAAHPDFLFIAEVYWDMEARLHSLGFDFCYDKRLYDRAREGHIQGVRDHLIAPRSYQDQLVRFIENHDEHRAAEAFGKAKSRAAAVLVCTLPGATLLHAGQSVGRKVKLPVQIGRQPDEPLDLELRDFYLKLLAETRARVYQDGEWWVIHATPGQANGSYRHLIAYAWRRNGEYRLIVINYSDTQSQGHIPLDHWPDIGKHQWHMTDVLDGEVYLRDGAALMQPGLYVDLPPFEAHIMRF